MRFPPSKREDVSAFLALERAKVFLTPAEAHLRQQRPVELRTPGGRVRVRLGARDVAFPEVWTRRVPFGRDPRIELAPGGGEAFVGPVEDRPRYHRGQQS